MEIRTCLLTKNDCYKKNVLMKPIGIVVHSTGANNPYISRYVQPDDGILGKNKYNNDWNRSGVTKCVNAFIGYDKDKNVRCYQTLPWTCRPWGCGSGSKGSYNSNHIQFEICEDDLKSEKYFNEAMAAAVNLCAYLAKKYKLNIDNIVSHKEAHDKGYASNHGDIDYWLKKYGKSMKWFKQRVDAKLNVPKVAEPSIKKGKKNDAEQVKLLQMDLNWLMDANLEIDGSCGSKTDAAIRKFQEKYNLEVDGSYGRASYEKMKTLLKI